MFRPRTMRYKKRTGHCSCPKVVASMNYGDVVKWPNTSVCLTDIFAGSNPAVLATYSIRLAGRWHLPYKQTQPWFESKIEYYRELAQLEEQQSPKLRVGCSRHSFPANKLLWVC